MNKFKKWVEPTFTVLCLLQYAQGIIPLLITRGASEGDGVNPNAFNYTPNLFLFFLIYLITIGLLILRWKKVIYVISQDGWLWALLGVAFISCLWSAQPSVTFSSSIALTASTLFGLYFATRYSLKEQIQLLVWMYGLIILLSVLFAIVLPQYGFMSGIHEGAFRGIFTHKNIFGKISALGGIVFLLAVSTKKSNLLLWSGLVSLFVLLILAGSKTALGNFLLLIIVALIYQILRWRYYLLIPIGFALIATGSGIIVLFLQDPAAGLDLIGRDTTLTGRTDTWAFAIDMIEKRPWFGYGFTAFWNGLNGESAYIIRSVRWDILDSHNGILDLWLELGFVGVVVFLLGYWTSVIRAIALVRSTNTPEGLFPLLYLTYFFLANITENTLLLKNSLFWVLYATVVLSMLIPQPMATSDHPMQGGFE
ncbi:MAG: O-antigen ligase family protein [Cyanobacteria bacterium RU_5_0]|nr:O-antigen ligase family protein [Cyanobacteria bacterium RU_5_0]